MIETLSIQQQFLQISTLTTIILLVGSLLFLFLGFWFLKNHHSNSSGTNGRISIKIDRNGKHRYEVLPDSENGNLKFWIRLAIALLLLSLLWLPIKNLLSPQY